MNLLESALNYKKNSYSIIATDNVKRSLIQWKKYQNEIASDEDLKSMFSHHKAQGIAVVCGKVSGNLEVIDVDCKYGINFNDFATEIRKAIPFTYGKLMIVQTKSQGYHIYYRCDKIEGNQKLANRPATAEELKDNPNVREFVLIETRGEGGYVIAPPSEGYKNIQLNMVQKISEQERDIILSIARSFNQVIVEAKMPSMSEGNSFGKKPWEDYNERVDIVQLLNRNGWDTVEKKGDRIFFKRPGATTHTSANFHIDKRIFYVFTTSSQFENKGYTPFAVFALLECNGDFREATRRAVEEGYGERKKIVDKKLIDKINVMINQGFDRSDMVDRLMIDEQLSRDEATVDVNTVIADNDTKIEKFWTVEYNRNNVPKISIQKYQLEKFLSESGFGLYFHDVKSNVFRVIREKDGFVEEINTEQVKKFIKEYILELPERFDKKGTQNGIGPSDLLEIIYKGADNYFNNSFLEFLQHVKPNILKDTHDTCYFAFKNGVVEINKKEIKLKKYGEIDKSIWKSQVNSDFNITIDQEFEPELCEYFRFITKISGDNEERRIYAMTLIGYILHSYKDPSKPYAPILAEETDDEAKGGGTGKGIFFKAIAELIPTVRIDGKNFKPDKSFAFQRVTLGTKLVVIEDCPKNVDFEKYYPTITEGMTVERKNRDEMFLNYSESPKISFTTNYSIANNAEHAKRRQRVFEFAPFFNSKNTPLDLFGHKLFDDWDPDEYNRFYNLMFFCVKLYMEFGILPVDNSDKLKRKNVKLSFGEEFLEYIDEIVEKNNNNYYMLSDEWRSFLAKNELEKKDYSLKRFRKAIEIATQTLGLNIEWSKNRQNNNIKQFKFV